MEEISSIVGEDFEFSILLKGKYNEDGNFIVDVNDYVIPKQKVSSSTIRYDNSETTEYITEGYNTVIHKHPHGFNEFSRTDYEFINKNFMCSILYTDNKFVMATLLIPLKLGFERENGECLNDFLDEILDEEGIVNNNLSDNYMLIEPKIKVIPMKLNLVDEKIVEEKIEKETYRQYLGKFDKNKKGNVKEFWERWEVVF